MRHISAASTITVLFLCCFASAQTSPTRMMECESADNACTQNPQYKFVWSFDGTTGKITTPADNSGTELTIQSMDQSKIVIHRVDQPGPTAGRSGTYTGSIHGSFITGTIQWQWPDHPNTSSSGTWTAELEDQRAAASSPAAATTSQAGLPTQLLECEGNGSCNAAWVISGPSGKATYYLQKPLHAELTIVRSDPNDILIKRTDLDDGNSAVYYGTLRDNTYSGAVVWSGPGHSGDASGHWSASIPQTTCDPHADLSSDDALQIGRNALMFNHRRDAFDCYLVAAKTGDATAQTAVGLIYYQGNNADVPQDYGQALYWLKKAAMQDVYAANKTLADMYTLGQGTPRDLELSKFYADKAAEQKRDKEREEDKQERAQARAEEHEERAADRRAQVLTGFVMAATFGAFLF